MKLFYILIASLLITGCTVFNEDNNADNFPFHIGTYTSGSSEGIYNCTLNSDGSFDTIKLVGRSSNPSFLVASHDNKFLLATNEVDSSGTGFIESYLLSKDSLIFISRKTSGGAHPCHLDIDSLGNVLVSNYSGGNVGLLNLDSNGYLSELLFIDQHSGSGSTDRQEGPHAHSAYFSPTGQIISADLGTNELWLSLLDESFESLIADDPKKVILDDGAGPRHIAFHPNGKWIYVINELNSTVTHLDYNSQKIIRILKSISTLPEEFNGSNYCADIKVSKDGAHLYASNRGHNSIAIFEIDPETGELGSQGHSPTHGDWPRNFSLSPDDRYLLVANQRSNNIVSFERDEDSGELEYVSQIEAPEPVCILF